MPSSNSRAARLMIRSLTLSPSLPDLVFTSSSFRTDKRFKINRKKLFMVEVYLVFYHSWNTKLSQKKKKKLTLPHYYEANLQYNREHFLKNNMDDIWWQKWFFRKWVKEVSCLKREIYLFCLFKASNSSLTATLSITSVSLKISATNFSSGVQGLNQNEWIGLRTPFLQGCQNVFTRYCCCQLPISTSRV